MAVRGVAPLRRKLRRLRSEAVEAVDREMLDAAEDLLLRSRALVPELDRDLVNSSDLLRVRSGSRVVFSVFYTAPHALIRHEDFYELGPISRLKPPTEDGPVGRKYLQRPFERNAQRWVGEVAAGTKQAIRKAAL